MSFPKEIYASLYPETPQFGGYSDASITSADRITSLLSQIITETEITAPDYDIADLLADIFHWCLVNDTNLVNLVDSALSYFREEAEGEVAGEWVTILMGDR
jgi:hypothetical protein